MKMLNISEAKAQLSAVVEKVVSKRQEFLIGRAGKPVAKIVPYEPSRKPRKLGLFRGKIRLARDWDQWPEDLEQMLGIR